MFYLIVGFMMASLVALPIIAYLVFRTTSKSKEDAKGEAEVKEEQQTQPHFVTDKEILAKRVDMRIWDALNTKFGKGKVVKYEPMRGYTEGGDMDIVVVFADGTSGIYRAYLPLCKLRGAEQKNASDDYRIKPGSRKQKNKKEEILDYIKKNIVAGKPLLVPKEMYADMDVAELTEDILFEELADKVSETENGLSLLLQSKTE